MSRCSLMLLVFPSAALAHPGGHDTGLAASMIHALTQPDHLLTGAGVALGAVIVRLVVARRGLR